MAEIALVASVIQVAGFGAAVAKNLYDAADVMIHANQQILALAKHVSQFTAVLKHMGEVLDAEKANCSKTVLRDIRSIKHSCKKTFKEIKATVKSKKFRAFIPVKWMFKRTKAMELEARLDSHQSMLQCIITTLTVSKLGHMATRSKQDSQQISGLTEEITLLKAFIMETHNNVTELRRNESRAEMETLHQPNDFDYGDGDATTSFPQSDDDQEAESESSDSDEEEPRPPDGDRKTSAVAHQKAAPSDGKTRDNRVEISKYSSQPPGARVRIESESVHRESNLLLQMVPYRPKISSSIPSDRLLPAALNGPKSTNRPTESVRLLLDKWTVSGSAPISNILDEESVREEKEEIRREEGGGLPHSRARHRTRTSSPRFGEFSHRFAASPYPENYNYDSDEENDLEKVPPSFLDPHMRYVHPHPRPLGLGHFWRSHDRFAPSYSQLGDDIIHALRSSRGGIYYTKANNFRQVHYVDTVPIYMCNLVPSHLIPPNESVPLNTEIWDGLVRKEALDLLGYSFSKTEQGTFLIQEDLDLREIEELVKLSYQALDRRLTVQSRNIIKEQGLKEAVDSINLSTYPVYPPRSAPFPYSPPPLRPPPRSSYPPPPPPRSSYPPPPFPRLASDPGRLEDTKLDITGQEVRFTLPRTQLTSSAPKPTEKTKAPMPSDPLAEKSSVELRALYEKRKKLQAKLDDAEKAKDFSTAADLKYFAIPDIEKQIKEKEEQEKKPDGTPSTAQATAGTSDAKPTKGGNTNALQTEVETESEYSDDASGSADVDLYD